MDKEEALQDKITRTLNKVLSAGVTEFCQRYPEYNLSFGMIAYELDAEDEHRVHPELKFGVEETGLRKNIMVPGEKSLVAPKIVQKRYFVCGQDRLIVMDASVKNRFMHRSGRYGMIRQFLADFITAVFEAANRFEAIQQTDVRRALIERFIGVLRLSDYPFMNHLDILLKTNDRVQNRIGIRSIRARLQKVTTLRATEVAWTLAEIAVDTFKLEKSSVLKPKINVKP